MRSSLSTMQRYWTNYTMLLIAGDLLVQAFGNLTKGMDLISHHQKSIKLLEWKVIWNKSIGRQFWWWTKDFKSQRQLGTRPTLCIIYSHYSNTARQEHYHSAKREVVNRQRQGLCFKILTFVLRGIILQLILFLLLLVLKQSGGYLWRANKSMGLNR